MKIFSYRLLGRLKSQYAGLRKRQLVRKWQMKRNLVTSVSDNQSYPNFCMKASQDLKLFNSFRQNPVYIEILEHVSFELGRKYLDEILKDQWWLPYLEELKNNDSFGGPKIYTYPEIGLISPSTLRYIKVLSDLKKCFRSLDNLKICEIGCGYGGQCRLIHSVYKPKSYKLVDIKPALDLSQRYLDHYAIDGCISYTTLNELDNQDYDLIISNYAFSELPGTIQEIYLKKIVLNSSRGYITYNEINPPEFRSILKEKLLERIKSSEIVDEIPKTHPNNCIIIWSQQSKP